LNVQPKDEPKKDSAHQPGDTVVTPRAHDCASTGLKNGELFLIIGPFAS
jgi:hypothetical protein